MFKRFKKKKEPTNISSANPVEWEAFWAEITRARTRKEKILEFFPKLWYRKRYVKYWFVSQTKYRWQRSQRGWSDADLWNADSYICETLASMLRGFMEAPYTGHPVEFCNGKCHDVGKSTEDGCSGEEKYVQYLTKIAEDLEAYNNRWVLDAEGEEKATKDGQKALRRLAKHLPSLWT